jgi:hypothetical protein
MMHIARFPGANPGPFLQRTLEFLDDLFEEKPATKLRPEGGRHPLSFREDVLLLYARCCSQLASIQQRDSSSSPSSSSASSIVNAQKGQGAFEEAFKMRVEGRDEDALKYVNSNSSNSNAGDMSSSVEVWWSQDPMTHEVLAREHADKGEPTLAVFHFEKCAEIRQRQG